MTERHPRFKQREIARALRAAASAGTPARRVMIDNSGNVTLFIDDLPEASAHSIDRENTLCALRWPALR
jgi:hypothetical protein